MKESKGFDLLEKLEEGMKLTYERLIAYKRLKKSPLVVFKDGKIVELNAEDLPDKID